jgi:polyferredoxin
MYQALADLVLLLHLGVVIFVIGGLAVLPFGYRRGWTRVQGWAFRLMHLLAIGIVVAQSWLGVVCPLTTLESWLRIQSGALAYEAGFIEHWVQAIIFYQAPVWVFTLVYTTFAALVGLAWLRYPRTPSGTSLSRREGLSKEHQNTTSTGSAR